MCSLLFALSLCVPILAMPAAVEVPRYGVPTGPYYGRAPSVTALTPTIACDKIYPGWVTAKANDLMMLPQNLVAWISYNQRRWKWPILGECYPKKESRRDREFWIDLHPEEMYFDCRDNYWWQVRSFSMHMPETEIMEDGAFRLQCEPGTEKVQEPVGIVEARRFVRWGHVIDFARRWLCSCRAIIEAPQLIKAKERDCVDRIAESSQAAIARGSIRGRTRVIDSLRIAEKSSRSWSSQNRYAQQTEAENGITVVRLVSAGRITACANNDHTDVLTIHLGFAQASTDT